MENLSLLCSACPRTEERTSGRATSSGKKYSADGAARGHCSVRSWRHHHHDMTGWQCGGGDLEPAEVGRRSKQLRAQRAVRRVLQRPRRGEVLDEALKKSHNSGTGRCCPDASSRAYEPAK
jgi:hypothetical protein